LAWSRATNSQRWAGGGRAPEPPLPRAALVPKHLRGRVFAVFRDGFFNLASGNLHDMDSIADWLLANLSSSRGG
jgi:hypothetical protein